MGFEALQVFAARCPFLGFAFRQQTAAGLDAFSFPVDARIRDRAGDEIVDDALQAFFAAEAIVERLLDRAGITGFTAKLLSLRNALLGALVGVATAGRE